MRGQTPSLVMESHVQPELVQVEAEYQEWRCDVQGTKSAAIHICQD